MKSIICIFSAIFLFAFVIEISNAQQPIPNPSIDFKAEGLINGTYKVKVWFSYSNQSSLYKTSGESTELSLCGAVNGSSVMHWNEKGKNNCTISCFHGLSCDHSLGCGCGLVNIWGWLQTATYTGVCQSQFNSQQGYLFQSSEVQGCFNGDTPFWLITGDGSSFAFSKYETLKDLHEFVIPQTCSCPSEFSEFETSSRDISVDQIRTALMQNPIKYY